MPNKNLTDLILIVDRSGSMQTNREETQGAISHFIAEQVKQKGECDFSLLHFDHECEYVFLEERLRRRRKYSYKLVPRGMTALYDAMGRAIVDAKRRIKQTPKSQRPWLVTFVIVTDGRENNSREYDRATLEKMIQKARNKKRPWQFVFIGAGWDAFEEGRSLKMGANTVHTHSGAGAMSSSYAATADLVGRMRTNAVRGCTGQSLASVYTVTELDSMSGKENSDEENSDEENSDEENSDEENSDEEKEVTVQQ